MRQKYLDELELYMVLLNKSYQQLILEAIDILLKVKNNIKDDSDLTWVYYETPEQMRNEIDQYIAQLENENTHSLDEILTHFLPTAAYQEHSMSNKWSAEYLILAEKFDKIYEALKKRSN